MCREAHQLIDAFERGEEHWEARAAKILPHAGAIRAKALALEVLLANNHEKDQAP